MEIQQHQSSKLPSLSEAFVWVSHVSIVLKVNVLCLQERPEWCKARHSASVEDEVGLDLKAYSPPWRLHLSLRCTAFILEDNVVRLQERSAWEEAKWTVSKREQVESVLKAFHPSLKSSFELGGWDSELTWNDCRRGRDNARRIMLYAMEMQQSQFSNLPFLPEVLGRVRDALVVISKQSWND